MLPPQHQYHSSSRSQDRILCSVERSFAARLDAACIVAKGSSWKSQHSLAVEQDSVIPPALPKRLYPNCKPARQLVSESVSTFPLRSWQWQSLAPARLLSCRSLTVTCPARIPASPCGFCLARVPALPADR